MKVSGAVRFLGVALVAGLVLGVLAPSVPLRGQPARKAGAGKAYEVDTKLSRVYVRVDPDGRGHAHGIVGRLASGSVALGATTKAGTLVFDLTSFAADDTKARKYVGVEGKMSDADRRSVTRTMLGAAVLNAREYPKATYALEAVTPLDGQAAGAPGRYRFEGRLSLHGTEQAVRFEAKAEATKTKGHLQVRGQFSLRQTDYKIKPYSALFGALKVKNLVRVYGDLLLVPKKAN